MPAGSDVVVTLTEFEIVALTVELDATLLALNVITQLWLPWIVALVLTDAVTVPGVVPDVGLRFSQAQSEPGEAVKLKPLEGFVLLTVMVCGEGVVPGV